MIEDVFRLVGTVLDGKYRIEAVVGEGGFGLVYQAIHLGLGHRVAIKCLNIPSALGLHAQEHFLQRFQAEGRLLTRLDQHPSIVRVIDYGTSASSAVAYLVLEWLQGKDLRTLRTQHSVALSEQQALALLHPVVEALALAHGMGIVHRDIKPSNLFLSETVRGTVLKLLDFGIAKAMDVEGSTRLSIGDPTKSTCCAFSPEYGSPEQFRSKKFGPTGPWTDVHALGLVLSELVVGRPVVQGDDPLEIHDVITADIRPSPRALLSASVDEFEQLCCCAIAKCPADRYQNAQALLSAIESLLRIPPGIPRELEEALHRLGAVGERSQTAQKPVLPN